MTSRQHEAEGLVGKALKMGLMGVTTAATGSTLAHGLDGAFPTDQTVDVTGLNGAHVDTGSTLHHGPEEGGELLERPSAGYMAHASSDTGIEMHQGMDVSTLARNVDQAGTFGVGGDAISVMDYLPGGDMVQMAAGHVDPSQLAMTIAQHGMQQEMSNGGMGDVALARDGIGAAGGSDAQTAGHSGVESGSTGPAGSPAGAGGQPGGDGHAANGAGTAAVGAGVKRVAADGSRIPDADEDARDLEALAFQHRMDLDTAVETSDQARVHTQIHAHGRTLEIDTDFEAFAKDNGAERAEAAEHVREAAHSPLSEMEHTRPDMHFRSKVQAHLDAASRDEGMAL